MHKIWMDYIPLLTTVQLVIFFMLITIVWCLVTMHANRFALIFRMRSYVSKLLMLQNTVNLLHHTTTLRRDAFQNRQNFKYFQHWTYQSEINMGRQLALERLYLILSLCIYLQCLSLVFGLDHAITKYCIVQD